MSNQKKRPSLSGPGLKKEGVVVLQTLFILIFVSLNRNTCPLQDLCLLFFFYSTAGVFSFSCSWPSSAGDAAWTIGSFD